MAKKIVSVVGATGIQGGSIVRTLIQDGRFSIRGLTRSPESSKAQALAALGVEIIQCDINNYESVKKAFAGSHIIFGVTDFYDAFVRDGPDEAIQFELGQGINLAKAAAATATLEHYIWSTLPNSDKNSNGKAIVPHFQAKSMVDDYIKSNRNLYQKTTFLWLGFYVSNFTLPIYQPVQISTVDSDKYCQILATPPSVRFKSLGDAGVNIGLFFKAIIEQPSRTLPGKYVFAHTEDTSAGEMLAMWATATDNKALFIQVKEEVYFELWPLWGEEIHKMHVYWDTAKENCWVSDGEVLTKEDLKIDGLVDTVTAFKRMRQLC